MDKEKHTMQLNVSARLFGWVLSLKIERQTYA